MLDEVGTTSAFFSGGLNQPQHDVQLMESRKNKGFPCFCFASDLSVFHFKVQEIAKDVEPYVFGPDQLPEVPRRITLAFYRLRVARSSAAKAIWFSEVKRQEKG